MNIRALIRKAWRRLSGRSGSPEDRKARQGAKRGGRRNKKKRGTTSGSPPS